MGNVRRGPTGGRRAALWCVAVALCGTLSPNPPPAQSTQPTPKSTLATTRPPRRSQDVDADLLPCRTALTPPARPRHGTGRQTELTRIAAALHSRTSVHLIGPEGMGKTQLAIEALFRLKDQSQLPETVLWVAVGDRPLPLVVHRLSQQACRADLLKRHSSPEAILWPLKRDLARRKALVVLSDVRASPVEPHKPATLLCGLAGVTVLLTGPSAMDTLPCDFNAERIDVEGLMPEACAALASDLARLSKASRDDAARLCARLQYHPLAVALVARELKRYPQPAIALKHALRPTGLPTSSTPIGKMLDQVLARTLKQLNKQQHVLFRALGIFPKNIPLEASLIGAVAGSGASADLDDNLRALCDLGLLRRDDQARRYYVDALIRAGATKQLQTDRDLSGYWSRLIEHLESTGQRTRAEPLLVAAIMDRLVYRYRRTGREGARLSLWANDLSQGSLVRAGLDEAETWLEAAHDAAQKHDPTSCASLALALGDLLTDASRTSDAIDWYNRALADARRDQQRALEGTILDRLGQASFQFGLLSNAITFHAQAHHVAQSLGDRKAQGQRLSHLAKAYLDQGESRLAIAHYEQALAIARELGDRRREAADLGNLGVAYRDLGEVRKAIRHHKQALVIARELGDRPIEAAQLGNLGTAYRTWGKLQQAIEYRLQALEVVRATGDRVTESNLLSSLGDTYADQGDLPGAIRRYEQALALARDLGDHIGENTLLANLGVAYRSVGDNVRAIHYYKQALAVARNIGDRHGEGMYLADLGRTHLNLDELSKAIDYYQEAVAIARQLGDTASEAARLSELGGAYRKLGDLHKTRAQWQRALSLFEASASPRAQSIRERLAQLQAASAQSVPIQKPPASH